MKTDRRRIHQREDLYGDNTHFKEIRAFIAQTEREMNDTSKRSPYRSVLLESFSVSYGKWHGYTSLVICTIGIILNIINIIVLTRKQMQTPINCVLTWLAFFDIATMMSYVPFAYHFYCRFPSFSLSLQKNSKSWMYYLLVHLNFTATTHTISIWLAVALAILRHRHILSPAKGSLTRMRRLIRARITVYVIVCMSVFVMIPNYIIHRLEERGNSTIYVFKDWKLGFTETKPLVTIALIMYSTLAKILPCLLIILYGGFLLSTIRKTHLSKRRLSGGRMNMNFHRNRMHSRTTAMLLTVIVLFLITELPQGILILCSVFLRHFFEHIYIPLGDIMDLLALTNNAINFVLYCTMSHEFRRTFVGLFCSISPRANSISKQNGGSQTSASAKDVTDTV